MIVGLILLFVFPVPPVPSKLSTYCLTPNVIVLSNLALLNISLTGILTLGFRSTMILDLDFRSYTIRPFF
jgi:hypothetical protein